MAAPVKLTVSEGVALAMELADAVGHDQLLTVLTATIGVQRALALAEDHTGRISKAETVALVKAVLPLVPGDTLKAKIKVAIAALRRAIPDKARQDAILAYVVQRIKEWKNPPASAAIPAWDACTRASCWNGSNAKQRMMNMLSPAFTDAKFAEYRDWMKSIGCNTSHVFLSNKADGEGGGYCIYGTSWTWEINAAFCEMFRKRIADLRAHGFAVVVWLLADDSSAWNREAAKNFPKYLQDLKAQGLLDQASTVVAGLELDEYYQSAQVSALVNAIRRVYPGKVGTHQTSGRYEFAALADICFYQVSPGKSAAQIKAEAAKVVKATGKPVNFFELDRQPNRALCDAAFAGGAFAVGNWMGEAAAQTPADNDVDLSTAKWLGRIDGSKAKVGASIDPLTFDGKAFRYKQSPETAAWVPRFKDNGKDLNSAACFFVMRDGRWTGGRFDDCSETRNSRDRKNIDGGYLGIKPKVGEEVRFCLINKTGTVRSNAPGVIWK